MEALPITCSLSAADLADREGAWRRLIDGWATGAEAIPGGVRLRFRAAAGLAGSLAELVALEADCCPWMGLRLVEGEQLELSVTGPDAAVEELRRTFSVSAG
jgi:hypothetical protein